MGDLQGVFYHWNCYSLIYEGLHPLGTNIPSSFYGSPGNEPVGIVYQEQEYHRSTEDFKVLS